MGYIVSNCQKQPTGHCSVQVLTHFERLCSHFYILSCVVVLFFKFKVSLIHFPTCHSAVEGKMRAYLTLGAHHSYSDAAAQRNE